MQQPQHNSLSMEIKMHSQHYPLHTTNKHTKHICASSSKMAQDVEIVWVLWCHSHLVGLVFYGSIPTCTGFPERKTFCDLFKQWGRSTAEYTYSLHDWPVCVAVLNHTSYTSCKIVGSQLALTCILRNRRNNLFKEDYTNRLRLISQNWKAVHDLTFQLIVQPDNHYTTV